TYPSILVPLDTSNIVEFIMYSNEPNMNNPNKFTKENQQLIYNIYKDTIQQIIDHNNNPDNVKKITCYRITLLSSTKSSPINYQPKTNKEKEKYKRYLGHLAKIILKSLIDSLF